MLTIKQGDLRPYIDMWLEQPLGTPIPAIDTATSITFKAKRNDRAATDPVDITGSATIIDVVEAHVRYHWVAGDTDIKGIYNVEVELLWPGAPAEPMTVPTEGFGQFQIVDDLDPDPVAP